ncbi:hypothetical protein D3C73_1469060 [compost metagenome]
MPLILLAKLKFWMTEPLLGFTQRKADTLEDDTGAVGIFTATGAVDLAGLVGSCTV